MQLILSCISLSFQHEEAIIVLLQYTLCLWQSIKRRLKKKHIEMVLYSVLLSLCTHSKQVTSIHAFTHMSTVGKGETVIFEE